MANPTPNQNALPPPIQDLTAREIFLFTKIPLHLLEGFINGTFKPNRKDREKLSEFGRKFFYWNEAEKQGFIERKKYRTVRAFLSLVEKDELFNQPGKDGYNRKLDEYVQKYWDQIVIAIAGE